MSWVLDFRRYAPFATFGGGFHGDGRAVPNYHGTARTRGVVEFDIAAGTATGTGSSGVSYHAAYPSYRRTGTTSCSITKLVATRGSLKFTVQTAGALPLIPGAPDIDTFIDFSVTQVGRRIVFGGLVRGDNFPNAEVFIHPAGVTTPTPIAVWHFATTGGRNTGPMTRLAGSHSLQVLGTFTGVKP
ncbi:MAG: hypothetical protein QNJ15_10645 [Erythrobacter sp.]|nr:hypothetical protein [Erythrobacter sp.]